MQETTLKDFATRGLKAQSAVNKVIDKSKKNGKFQLTTPSAQVQFTTDYDKFKRLPGNRPIIPSHVLQLVNSMRDHDLLVPIIVNEKMQIIDGQHRLEARRELELQVPYIQSSGMTLSDVQKLNSTAKGWISDDYARSFVEQGNVHYKTYMDFRKTWGLPHEASLLLLAGRGPKALRQSFITGEFRIMDLEGPRKMASILHAQIKPIWPAGWKDSFFIRALYIANSRIGFQMDKLLSVLPAQRSLLYVYRSVDSYLLMIENIYNSMPGRKKIAIRYGDSVPMARDIDGKFIGYDHAAMSDAKRKSMARPTLQQGSMADKVMQVLQHGKRMPVKDIATEVYQRKDPSQKQIDDVSNRCGHLTAIGLVIRVSRGVYQLASKVRQTTQAEVKRNTSGTVVPIETRREKGRKAMSATKQALKKKREIKVIKKGTVKK